MTRVTITGLTKRFVAKPPTVAVDDLDLEIEEGEFLVLLGPSGCGKTTTLRCLAGLETPTAGTISFGSRRVFDSAGRLNVPPDGRNVGMVFQSYALWPHMTVRRNINYPLRARKIPKATCRGWVEETAELVDCQELLDRYPAQLSGGQQQRVALARGLVARPELMLFDEPLSNLDARLRDQVRTQIHELHGRLKFTAVFVTHDQREALALGTRLAIMRAGHIEQLDTPERVFEQPASEYVAGFTGMTCRLELQRAEHRWVLGGQHVDRTDRLPEHRDQQLVVRLRPDDVQLLPVDDPSADGAVGFAGEVVDAEFGGKHIDVRVAVTGQQQLDAQVPSGELGSWARSLQPGQPVSVRFSPHAAAFFGPDGARVDAHVPREAPVPAGVVQ